MVCAVAATIELQGVIPVPAPPFVPGPVTNFNITLVKHTGQSPSISMSWCRPRNCTSDGNIKRYHINVFTAASVHLSSTNEDGTHKLRPFTVPGNVKKFSVTHKDGLFPLNLYIVELKAESQDSIIGEEVRDSVFIRKLLVLPVASDQTMICCIATCT